MYRECLLLDLQQGALFVLIGARTHTHMYMYQQLPIWLTLSCKQVCKACAVNKHSLPISKKMQVLFFLFGCTDGDDDGLMPLLFNSLSFSRHTVLAIHTFFFSRAALHHGTLSESGSEFSPALHWLNQAEDGKSFCFCFSCCHWRWRTWSAFCKLVMGGLYWCLYPGGCVKLGCKLILVMNVDQRFWTWMHLPNDSTSGGASLKYLWGRC